MAAPHQDMLHVPDATPAQPGLWGLGDTSMPLGGEPPAAGETQAIRRSTSAGRSPPGRRPDPTAAARRGAAHVHADRASMKGA